MYVPLDLYLISDGARIDIHILAVSIVAVLARLGYDNSCEKIQLCLFIYSPETRFLLLSYPALIISRRLLLQSLSVGLYQRSH
jgi:hypothetical protein